jgi:hypothetical protein
MENVPRQYDEDPVLPEEIMPEEVKEMSKFIREVNQE